jgi:hypothetical protein
MKIEEVMVEANTNRKIVGQAQAAANLKTNREKSAAWTKQMKDTSAETEAPAAAPEAPATKPTPNYGAGGAGIPNVQATPVQKTPAAVTTPNYGPKNGITATPVQKLPPAAEKTPVPGAGMPTPPGAGMPGRNATGPELSNIVGSNFMKGFAQGVGSGDLSNAVNAASQSNIAAQKAKDGTPAVPGEEQPAADPATAKAGEKELSPGASVPGETPAGATTPDQDVTLANPIAKPDAEKPEATPVPATAKGKTMTKQEILSWISRNDEDNPALQSFKDGITAAEKSGAGTVPAAQSAASGTTPNYGAPNPGIQNIQAGPNKVTATSKVNYGSKTTTPDQQTQMARV